VFTVEKTTRFFTSEEVDQKWHLVDANGKTLGRIATQVATLLRGKHKPQFTPNADLGDFVVVVNAEKIKVHPKKYEGKVYRKWSGYPGGLKVRTLAEVQKKHPDKIIIESVRRMLPKTLLGKVMLSKLKVYAGTDHPHAAQKPEVWAPLA
jgi:large subunit ribosomal protein L13